MVIPEVIQLYFDYFKKHPLEVLINITFMFLIPVQDVFLPHCYGKIISELTSGNDIIKPFVIVLITMIILQIGYYVGDWHDSILYPRLLEHIRANILKQILKTYEQSYKELNIGEIVSALVKIPGTLNTMFERIKNNILPLFLTFTISVIYFFFVDSLLGISLLIFGVTFMVTLYLTPRVCSDITANRDKTLNIIYEEVDDVLRNLFSIYGGNQKDNEIQRCKEFEDIHQKLFRDTVTCIFKSKVWITPIAVLFLCIFVFRCYTLLREKRIGTDKFVSVFIMMLYILNSMMYTNDQFRDIVFDWGVIKTTSNIIYPEIKQQLHRHDVIHDLNIGEYRIPEYGIGLMNVTFRYPNVKNPIFTNVSLHIKEKERVIITGDIGSGKSTLLKLFLKYYEPEYGTLYLHGNPYANIDVIRLRKIIGYVPQMPILFNRTVIENIAYGTDISREKVIDFLQKYDILHEFTKLEHGLDTKIGKNGSLLSGGQRQLVWFIRVILSNPHILILDEPTASIDTKSKELLFRILDDYMQDKTIIMVTHDDYLKQKATRRIHMTYGKIAEDKYLSDTRV